MLDLSTSEIATILAGLRLRSNQLAMQVACTEVVGKLVEDVATTKGHHPAMTIPEIGQLSERLSHY